MAGASKVEFHLTRERQCREMADHATDRAVIALHNQLADHHAAAAALELSRRDQPVSWPAIKPGGASDRLARQASPRNPLARLN
jgi:hypothetical protein